MFFKICCRCEIPDTSLLCFIFQLFHIIFPDNKEVKDFNAFEDTYKSNQR